LCNVTTKTLVIRTTILLTLVTATACEIPFRHRQRHPYPAKAVTAKEGVSVLVAGSARCLVPTKVFPTVKVGGSFECNWREGGPVATP